MARLNDLPNCLLVKIFLRVNLITAHRSKLVCKRWHSIISEPYFADRFSQDEKLSSPLFHCRNLHNDKQILDCKSYTYHLNKQYFLTTLVVVVASSNDLLLCRSKPTSKRGDYYVYNTVSAKFLRLPSCPRLQQHATRCTGFTSRKDGEYAVVISTDNFYSYDLYPSLMWLFSSKTSKWVAIPCPTLKQEDDSTLRSERNLIGVAFKRQLFWYTNGVIIGIDPFNIERVENPWCFIDLPKGLFAGFHVYKDTYLGVCKKSLRFCEISPCKLNGTGRLDLILKVWDFNEDSSEWILQRHASMPNAVEREEYDMKATKVICCDPNDPDIIYVQRFVRRPQRCSNIFPFNLSTREMPPERCLNIFSFNLSTCEMIKLNSVPDLESRDYKSWEAVLYTVQWRPTPLPRLSFP